MDTKPLERFAAGARRELLASVAARVSSVLAIGSVARSERGETVRQLEAEIAKYGQQQVIDKVAYTWFNRLIALRYMDACGYTDSGVVSPAHGHSHGQPEILADAKRGHLDTEVVTTARSAEAIMGLLDGTRRSTDAEGEAYALLLTEYCRYWNKAMPFMFEREGDYTELLVPSGLLADGAILTRAREVLTADVCDDVEVIGWLYQFYVSERKDEVFAGFKKNQKAGADEIPAATQLFTPHWIVRYLVENSVGRLWMLNRPASRLVDRMDYYIAPIDDETDFLKVSGPEELTVIDPACGSGHMLTYAFDLLYAIYEEEGYAPSEIPSLILRHNLHGTEIDPRAGSLAAFALTMKARSKDRGFFKKRIEQKICVIEPIHFAPDELDDLWTITGGPDSADARQSRQKTEFENFWKTFQHADVFGSLIQPDADRTHGFVELFTGSNLGGESAWTSATIEKARCVLHQAAVLARKYAVVVANPPYMGGKQMNALLSQFMKDEYPEVKQDLYGAFVVRGIDLASSNGLLAIVIGDTWMSIKSFEAMRIRLLTGHAFDSFVHMRDVSNHPDIFGANAAFVLSMAGTQDRRAPFIRLEPLGSERKEQNLRVALKERRADSGFHLASGEDFAAIPGSPIVYWLSEKMRRSFATGRPLNEVANLRQGLATADNNRFLRLWCEVPSRRTAFPCRSREEAVASGARWVPYHKGGDFRKWNGNPEYVVNWEHEGAESVDVKPRSVIRTPKTYFSPSVSWSKISSGAPAFRAYPAGFIYDVAGTSIFATTDRERAGLLSFVNSQIALEQLAAIAPTLNYEVGQVSGLPIADATVDYGATRAAIAIGEAKADWDDFEISWEFTQNPLVTLFGAK
ncbi:BREX-1 system adenine-specific DNA-methyltransferase PglX [Psychromicrobium xiongbiense]|uniref:BREX-1 system adenine-specific DNA-methyltransferase PglX n=1 Tax=Psychromicrobium xiongbiense TaxID=3051184 RepID=UPI0025554C2D|nr:BREX-1 system adenine-specific DNA-methyltransferase PglX [Psychromicrobium sp. YIM S02556]